MTKPRKMNRKEVALLVLPCVALAIMGWQLRDRRSVLSTPKNTVTIDDIKFEPATPLDVSQGYDTRLTVKYSPAPLPSVFRNPTLNNRLDEGPLHSRLTYQANGVEHSFGTPGKTFQTAIGGHRHTYRFRLRQVPARLGQITLKAGVRTGYFYSVTLKNGKTISKPWYAPPLPIAFVVRKAGETIQMPSVSHLSPLRIEDIQIEKTLVAASAVETSVSMKMVSLNSSVDNPANSFRLLNARLVDANGKEIRATKRTPWFPGLGVPLQPFGMGGDGRNWFQGFNFNPKLIPANIPKVILKLEASVNDCWPLPISIMVRDNTRRTAKNNIKSVVKDAKKQ